MQIIINPNSYPEHVTSPVLQQRCEDGIQILEADIAIPGRGEPIKKGAVIIKGSVITWVGLQASLPAKFEEVSSMHVPVLMPGLWDCHCHFSGTEHSGPGYGPPVFGRARITRDLKNTLLAGFTSVRELAGFAGEISPAVEDGTIVGPHIY